MKRGIGRAAVVVLILLIPSLAAAGDITLPREVDARVFVARSEKNGLWEKTLVVQFPQRRRILSSNDGIVDVLAAANHAAHPQLWSHVCEVMKTDHEVGGKIYARQIQEKTALLLGIGGKDIAMMATAADMDNLGVSTKTYGPFTVVALVTAGARGNALRTGTDEGIHIEPDPAFQKPSQTSPPEAGTVNIMILNNAKLTDGAMVRAVITATEAKTAAFEDLKVPSTYTKSVQATGTGTDSVIIVSGVSGPLVTYPGGHSRIGELMGKAVYEAVVEALGKQNGFTKKR